VNLTKVENVKSNRRSLSGSIKTDRPKISQPNQKKKIKTVKVKQQENKDIGEYFGFPQFPNNMHAAKALIEFKKKYQKSQKSDNLEEAKEILKEYIRRFMKNTDYEKHFEPSVAKIMTEYGLVSRSSERNIKNLISLQLPLQQRDVLAGNGK